MHEPILVDAHAIAFIAGGVLLLQGGNAYELNGQSFRALPSSKILELSRRCHAQTLAYNCARAGKIHYPEGNQETP